MIQTKEITYGIYGRCLNITNGKIEVYVTLDFGPRICRVAFLDGENFFKEYKDFGEGRYLGDDCKFSDKRFFIRGGHRFCLSPESFPRTTYPDNKEVSYTITSNGAVFTQKKQEINEVELSIEVSLYEDENKVTVNHIAKNTGYWPKEFSIWAVSMADVNGVEVIPQNTSDTGLLPNRFLSIWPYTKLNDSRLWIGDKYIKITGDTDVKDMLKLGLYQEHPWSMFFSNGNLFVKTYTPVKGASYPDNNCTYETFACDSFIEIETLGELKKLNPGETNSHMETWYLYENIPVPQSDDELDNLASKLKLL